MYICTIICTSIYAYSMHNAYSLCMHFQCFKEKHCTLIVFHNRIFPKIGGGGPNALLAPPQPVLWGGHGPPGPPRGGPHVLFIYNTYKLTVNIIWYNLCTFKCKQQRYCKTCQYQNKPFQISKTYFAHDYQTSDFCINFMAYKICIFKKVAI